MKFDVNETYAPNPRTTAKGQHIVHISIDKEGIRQRFPEYCTARAGWKSTAKKDTSFNAGTKSDTMYLTA